MPSRGFLRWLVYTVIGLATVTVAPVHVSAQQNSSLVPLLQELLEKLPADATAPAEIESTETSDEPSRGTAEAQEALIPPPDRVLSRQSLAPVVAPTILPPATGPEADLARQLLAITDTEESQSEVRKDLAVDFLRRLRGRLDVPEDDVEAEPTDSAIVLATNQSGIPDGEELIFEVRLDNRRFVQSLFGIKRGDGILVDLAEAVELLELAIDVDPDSGRAEGFFINPNNTFLLDLDRGQVVIEGETVAVNLDDVRRLDDAILVHSDQFNVWFNVQLEVDFRDLIVNVVPQSPLPLQQRLLRQERIVSLRQGTRSPPVLPRLEDPYRLVALPLADVRLQSSLLDLPGQPLRTTQNYSIVGRGDLAFATSEFFVGGNQDDILNVARLTLRREDPTGGLFGPLQATRVEAGDTAAPGLPIGGTGIGAFVTNNTTGVQNLGTTTDFVGNQQPGTDVELYRNEILLNLQTVGDDGRYEFRNVPLLLGENRFRLVFYGLFGEIQEERVTRNVTSVGRLTGLPTYSAAVFKPGEPLIPLDENSQDSGPLASAFTAQRNFTNGVQASTGLSFLDSEDPGTGKLDVGVGGPLFSGSASLQTTTSFDKGWTASGQYRTNYKGSSVGLSFTTVRSSSPSNSDSFRADLSGAVPLVGSVVLPYSLFVNRIIQEDGLINDLAEVRNSSGLGRYRVSHSLTWNRIDLPTANEVRSLTGNLQNTFLLSPINIRLGANYRLLETRELQQLDGEVNWTINNRSQVRLGYQRFLLSKREAFSLGGSYRFDRLIVSPTVTYDSNDQLFALLSVSLSAGRDPISGKIETSGSTFSGSGAVAARVYRDENLNQTFDAGEELLEDVRVEAVHSNKSEDTNADGVAFIKRLTPYLLTDVRVRAGSLPDPFLAPLSPGRSILPRPGRINVLDFPVALTTEIEGTVLALTSDGGGLTPLPGVTVELRNEKGEIVASEQTLFDGFFLFINVFPGTYTVHLGPENVTSKGLAIPSPRRIPVPVSSEAILGIEVITGPPGVDLPAPADAKIAAVRLGRLPTIESARASHALYLGLFPDLLKGLTLEDPFDQQGPPYELVLGRLTQGAAGNICTRLKTAKVSCEIVSFPFVAEAPKLVPTLMVNEGAPSLPTLQQPEPNDTSVIVDLGRYPTIDRADVAWSLLRRLYATDLDGADRQRDGGDDQVLRVGPMSRQRGDALCAQLRDSVPRCEVQPIPSDTPFAAAALAAPPALPGLRPVGPAVAAAPVPVVEDTPLPPIAGVAEATLEPTRETVVAVRLGEYGSQTGVDAGWQLMRRLYPDVLQSARPLESAEPVTDKRPLLVGPFTEIDALTVCARLIADGQACRVTQARL